MAQVTWRTTDGVVARVRLQAAHFGLSMNEYITRVLAAASDPTFSAEPAEQVRERLRLAGLLAEPSPSGSSVAPSPAEIRAATRRAGRGTELSELVRDGR